MKLIFLGTGGGRHAAMFQIRSTGGLLVQTDKGNIHIDPGPGALSKMNEISYNLQTTDAIIVTHCHPDHYSDVPNAIEGMTKGGWVKRGELYGSISVINGFEGIGPALAEYHLSLPEKVQVVRPDERYDIAGIKITTTKSEHNDPTNYGIILDTEHGRISYVSDTSFSEDIAKQYMESRILILPLTVPDDRRIKGHMDLLGAIEFIKIVKPELVILNHFGIQTVKAGIDDQAHKAADAAGIPVIASKDLMRVDVKDSILIDVLEGKHHDWLDFWKT